MAIFQGTTFSSIYRFTLFGAYLQREVSGAVFGYKGINFILSVEYYRCNRSNHILQKCTSFSFTYPLLRKMRYRSLLAVTIGILLFLLTSFSDLGNVSAENFSREKECSTCRLPKPSRSKHCSICNQCVACFGHHCRWMREVHNLLAVLFCSFFAFIGLVLAGRLKELKVVYILTENSFCSLAPHIQRLLGSYDTQIPLRVFMAIVSILLMGFFAYPANLCLINTSTNENTVKNNVYDNGFFPNLYGIIFKEGI
ncbi:hypothetical protein ES288_D08G264400v1 [Gossypium darwinii]|uniref:S-acyltransferase n=1 Tax=Gossypium darwinii TaxID=34276 RepID=A0A5D2BTT2_GOSDA|nr:hypothetical protein ES288_D08G264400v1 [Gossypium darwinii]